jgi:deazaflavin-dependent oxidoreductase (nitroreductase family)
MPTATSDTPPPIRRASAMQRWFLRVMVGLYRRTGGRIGGRVGSTPVLLLTTTGRKSGVPHTVPIGYFDRNGVRFVVASNAGAPRHPAWYFNLTAHPEVRVETGRDAYKATAATATGEERAQLWDFVMETAPPYRRYQRATRVIPLVILRRTE